MNFDRATYIKQPLPIRQELKTLFRRKDKLTIFEIGACEGEDSVKYARLFPYANIHAFEPLPANIVLIKKNLDQYGITSVQCYNKALSAKEGTAEFYVSEGRPVNAAESDWDYGNKSSSLLPPSKHMEVVDFIHFDKKIEVETITIKTFCNNNNIADIDFIHMDVQGAELMVLEGAADYINSIKVIWLEVSKIDLYKDQPLEADIKKYMAANNFVLIKDSLDNLQGDQLYVSKTFFPGYKTMFGVSFKIATLVGRLLAKAGLS